MDTAAIDLPKGTRIVGLDAWRVMLMLGGFLLHASLWQPPQPLFAVVAIISHSFRMGCFFAISGFLCGVSMRRHSPVKWLTRRIVQIGLPTLFGWVLICPLIRILSLSRFPEEPPPLPFDWHHIWFLVALLAYAPVAVLVDWIDQRWGLVDRLAAAQAERRSLLPMMFGVATLSFVLMSWTAGMIRAVAPSHLVPMLAQTPLMTGYLPDYLLGMAMARSTPLAHAVQRCWRAALVFVVAAVAMYGLWQVVAPMLNQAQQERGGALMMTVLAAFCPPPVFALIFRLAIGVRRVPAATRSVCDASLTMYLLHVPLLLVINGALNVLGLPPYVQYAAAIGAAASLAYATHRCIIRRIPVLSLIVNGRLDNRRQPFSRALSSN